jgi:hypothetical protein
MDSAIRLLGVCGLLFAFGAAAAQGAALNGVRVDPAYFYDMPEAERMTPAQLATLVVSEIKQGGFDTIFLYAYSPYYGAFYPTTYSMTAVEPSLGKANIFRLVTQAAQAQGIKVVGVLPVNDFRSVWLQQSAWRVKKPSGKDYRPSTIVSYLSPAHPDFRKWYTGFLKDFLTRNPGVTGIEAVEPGFDLFWDGSVDYNAKGVAEFNAKYPGVPTKGSTWKLFRAAKLTELLAIFSRTAHSYGKESHIVQTWTARPNGTLMTSAEIRDGLGFDWDGVLKLTATDRPDWINAEFMFQQWRAEYGTAVFVPSWTNTAAQAFVKFVAGRARSIIHAEYSEFSGPYGTYSASLEDVQSALAGVPAIAQGQDVYSYHLWRDLR